MHKPAKYLQTHPPISRVSDGPLVAAIKNNKGQLYFNEAVRVIAMLKRIVQSKGHGEGGGIELRRG